MSKEGGLKLYSEQGPKQGVFYRHVGTTELPMGRGPLDRYVDRAGIVEISAAENLRASRLSHALVERIPVVVASDQAIRPEEIVGSNVYNWRDYDPTTDLDILTNPPSVRIIIAKIAALPEVSKDMELNLSFLKFTDRIENALIAAGISSMQLPESGWAQKAAEDITATISGKPSNHKHSGDKEVTLFVSGEYGIKLSVNICIPETSEIANVNTTEIKVEPPQGVRFDLFIRPCDRKGNTMEETSFPNQISAMYRLVEKLEDSFKPPKDKFTEGKPSVVRELILPQDAT
ncbi:MAG: hypothetical protein HYT83_02780 [Candidatus Levybacteria bacterium]|nr:hypothetical protein [Candidatus Levybacteria bacterium]